MNRLLKLPSFHDEDRDIQAGLLNTLLWAFIFAMAALSVQAFITNRQTLFGLALGLCIACILFQVILRLGRLSLAAILFVSIMAIGGGVANILYATIRNPIAIVFPLLILAASLVLGDRAAWLIAAFAAFIYSFVTWGELSGTLVQRVNISATPVVFLLPAIITFVLTTILIQLSVRSSRQALARARTSEAQALQNAAELADIRLNLASQVEERTRLLERRAAQFRLAAEVGQVIINVAPGPSAPLPDVNQLLDKIASLISQQLGYYHVGIFLLDERGENAVLRAASSPGGALMLAQGHSLRVGSTGIVGYVTATRRPRIAQTVSSQTSDPDFSGAFGTQGSAGDPIHLKNPYLPETRAEIALPLLVGQRLWGALDVQSTTENAFSEEDLSALQVLANQVAVAIENANLLTETQQALERANRLTGELGRQGWLERISGQALAYTRRPDGLHPLSPASIPMTNQALSSQSPDKQAADLPSTADEVQQLAIPIQVRGLTIGYIHARKPQGAPPWNIEDSNLLTTLVEQLGVALDSARLYEETQERAERERLVSEITSRLRQALDVDLVLQTAAQEIYQTLDLHDVTIRLAPQTGPSTLSQSPGSQHPGSQYPGSPSAIGAPGRINNSQEGL